MSISRQEEIIAALWAIAALIAFGSGFATWGWVFAIKAALDTVASIVIGTKEAIAGVKARRAHNPALSRPPTAPQKRDKPSGSA